jgi:hypothetical protein
MGETSPPGQVRQGIAVTRPLGPVERFRPIGEGLHDDVAGTGVEAQTDRYLDSLLQRRPWLPADARPSAAGIQAVEQREQISVTAHLLPCYALHNRVS